MTNEVWIHEYMDYQGYDLVDRLARVIYPTSMWMSTARDLNTCPRTARIWAEWMVEALRNGRDL